MCTIMNNTVHVEIKRIEFRYPILRDQHGDRGVPLAEPAEELGTPMANECEV
jgi:hypothetical protein